MQEFSSLGSVQITLSLKELSAYPRLAEAVACGPAPIDHIPNNYIQGVFPIAFAKSNEFGKKGDELCTNSKNWRGGLRAVEGYIWRAIKLKVSFQLKHYIYNKFIKPTASFAIGILQTLIFGTPRRLT
ncbi:MAG: hypothetical protein K9I71_13250 [Ignavibacteriales bacterium]|nr:hypothetical protein [Ignavibacteriales bacterium]MCF8438676.1 hypothetical protein [Ignavibacteriales bacterium]